MRRTEVRQLRREPLTDQRPAIQLEKQEGALLEQFSIPHFNSIDLLDRNSRCLKTNQIKYDLINITL